MRFADLPLTPPFITKFSRGGRGARGAMEYAAGKAGATLLVTNMAGRTPRELAREIGFYRRAAPRCTRPLDFLSISVDPRIGRLTDEQWRTAAAAWLATMDYGDRPFTAWRHCDTDADHIHIAVCRIDSRGRVHKDSGNFRRSHVAAAAAAESIGLKPLPPRYDSHVRPAPRDHAVRARRRAHRRGTKANDPAAIAECVRAALLRAAAHDELVQLLNAAGIEVDFRRRGQTIYAWLLRRAGAEEWLAASSVHRSLSWSRVDKQLADRAALRAGELPAQPKPQPPAIAGTGKGQTMMKHVLGDDQHRHQVEVAQARDELASQLRAASWRQLMVASAHGIPRSLNDQAWLMAMLGLVIRWLSLGAIKLSNPAAAEIASRRELARAAQEEMDRRRGGGGSGAAAVAISPAARLRLAAEIAQAGKERRRELELMTSHHTPAERSAVAVATVEREFDLAQLETGALTLRAARKAYESQVDAVAQLAESAPARAGFLARVTGAATKKREVYEVKLKAAKASELKARRAVLDLEDKVKKLYGDRLRALKEQLRAEQLAIKEARVEIDRLLAKLPAERKVAWEHAAEISRAAEAAWRGDQDEHHDQDQSDADDYDNALHERGPRGV